MMWRRALREPLLHFLAGGGVLFVIFSLTSHAGAVAVSDHTILVDRATLLNFLQYRSKAFQNEYFTAQLDEMPAGQRENLVSQYVEEEMLYREAKSLALEDGDYVIRQRLVQKMRFLIDDLVDVDASPTDAQLIQYLERNREVYAVAPSVTFTHVFFDTSVHGDRQARELAERMVAQLNARGASFNDAPQFGDRFPFLQNYVERTTDYVASHLGDEFVQALAALAPSDRNWRGPIRSTYGYHAVLLTGRSAARTPELDEIRSQLIEDWQRDRAESARALSLRNMAAGYTVKRLDGNGEEPK